MGKEVQEINRIVYIEPNEFAAMAKMGKDSSTSRDNISWDPEELQFTVDLQVEMASRFDEIKNSDVTTNINNNSWFSFMSGEELATDTDGSAINSLTDAYTNISYTEYTSTGKSSRELLGIDSIEVNFSSHFYPEVKMRLTDVRGASLFQPSELNYQFAEIDKNSKLSDAEKAEAKKNVNTANLSQGFFKSLFHFPYPKFRLTLKGFYGDRVTFILSVSDFKSAFNADTGNFDVEISFIGYMYGMYTDIPMNLVFTSPYYNKAYWDEKVKDGTFAFYGGQPIITFPEFLDRYAHLLENINTAEMGEHSDIVRLNKLSKDVLVFEKLLRDFKTTTNNVFGTKSKYSIENPDCNVYVYNLDEDGFYKKLGYDDVGWGNLINTFNDNLNDIKKEYEEDNYTFLQTFTFPTENAQSSNTIPFMPLKYNDNFNQSIEETLTGVADLNNIKTKLETFSEKNDGNVAIFKKGIFEIELSKLIDKLNAEIISLKNSTDEDINQIIKDAIGFKLSVENIYRMIFAHIETFIDSFENCAKTINSKRGKRERQIGFFGLEANQTDVPREKYSSNTYLPPFPAILDKNNRMIFPGNSENLSLRAMDEVNYVKGIVESIKEYTNSTEKAINFLNQQKAEDTTGMIVNYELFTPICASDILYVKDNPSDPSPYKFLVEYLNKNKITGENMAKYVVYFIFARVLTAYAVNKKACNDVDNLFSTLCEIEVKNCITYLSLKIENLPKNGVINLLNDIINNYEYKTGSLLKDISGGILTENEEEVSFNTLGNVIPFFKNPFNQTEGGNGSMIEQLSTLCETNVDLKMVDDFASKLSEIYDGFSYLHYDQLYNKNLNNETLKYDHVRVRNVRNNNYNRSDNADVFFFTKNTDDETYGKTDLVPEFDKNSFVNPNSAKASDRIDDLFRDMVEGMNQAPSNDTQLRDYYTGFLGFGEWKSSEVEHIFLGKMIKDPKPGSNDNLETFEVEKNGETIKVVNSIANELQYATGTTNSDKFTAMLFLAGAADYFNLRFGTKDSAIDNITLKIVKDCENCRIVTIPYPLLLYYGSLIDFYKTKEEKHDSYNEELKILKSRLGGDAYGEVFYSFENSDVEYQTDYPYDHRHGREFIDKYGVLLENNIGSGSQNNYTYLKLYTPNGYTLYETRISSMIRMIYDQSQNIFNEWYESGAWHKIRNILINDIESYIGVVPEYVNDKGYRNVPLWKYNSESDKVIKKFLCLTRNYLVFNYNDSNSSDTIKFKEKETITLINTIINEFSKYTTKDEQEAEYLRSGGSDKLNTEDESSALYYTLKNLYDRWFASALSFGDFRQFKLFKPNEDKEERNKRNTDKQNKLRTEFNSFLYVNSFYKDISDSYIVNPDTLVNITKSYIANGQMNRNSSVYEFMAEIAEKNKLLMLALPVYNNFYDINTIKNIFTPNVLYSNNNQDRDKNLGVGNTYLIMYTGSMSNKLGDDSGDYQDDAPDLFGMAENHSPDTYRLFDFDKKGDDININDSTIDNNGESNGQFTVPAFGVTYAKQNQMYFKNISVNMDNPQVTDYSLANLIQISYGGSHGDVTQRFGVGQNIYSIYSNRSYTCTVEMMGCMNIMPSMYFQLNNIPMFRGLYYIIKVSHSVKAGDITTKFMGVRVNKNQLADVKMPFDFQSIYDKINTLEFQNDEDGKPLVCGSQDSIDQFKKNIKITDEMRTVVNTLNSLGWNKSAICGLCGTIGSESNFKYWLVNLSEFKGTLTTSRANATPDKPWVYGAGLIQWSLERKRRLIENVTGRDGRKLYVAHGANSVDDFLINMVPKLTDRIKLGRDKVNRQSDWTGGIENLTLEEQIYCINYELTQGSANKVGATLKGIDNTIEGVNDAVYTVYTKYVAFSRNKAGVSTQEEACEASSKYASQFNENTGLNKRIAYAQWVYEHWEQIVS